MSKRARSPSTANAKAETSPATKTVCIQLVIDPLAYQLILCELVPRTMVDLCRWNALMAWKDVSKDARASVMVFLREMLQPRYTALVNALFKWEKLPLDTRFEFPEPGGPLPVTEVDGVRGSNGNRDAVRPKHARASETLMPRALWVWAMTHSLFDTKDFPEANVAAALDECKARYSHDYMVEEPAFMIMSDMEKYKTSHSIYYKRWLLASNYPIPALISTFTCWRYGSSMNMGAPGNRQRFLKALLRQAWPKHEDLPHAIAFLLFWSQHTLFHTWVTDSTFRQSAIELLVVELMFEWRNIKPKNEGTGRFTGENALFDVIDWNSYHFYSYWFKVDPKEYMCRYGCKTKEHASQEFSDFLQETLDVLNEVPIHKI